jgi:hypothetical protein
MGLNSNGEIVLIAAQQRRLLRLRTSELSISPLEQTQSRLTQRSAPGSRFKRLAAVGQGDRAMPIDEDIIETPDGPMTWGEWKRKNPVQIPSRRTKGKKLPVKVKRFTGEK